MPENEFNDLIQKWIQTPDNNEAMSSMRKEIGKANLKYLDSDN